MLQSISQEVLSFYNFLKHPQQNIFKEKLSSENFTPVLLSYYFIFFCGILIMAPLAAMAGLESIPHKLNELQDISWWKLLLLAVITQPFLEELFFRFPLKYSRALLLLICTMIGMITYLVLSKFDLPALPVHMDTRTTLSFFVVLILSIGVIVYTYGERGYEKAKTITTNFFPHLFYAVAVYFAFVHFFNFEVTGNQWLFTPIMVLPQFIIGLYVGYTRLKYGFLSAVVIHMINNLIPLSIMLLADFKGL